MDATDRKIAQLKGQISIAEWKLEEAQAADLTAFEELKARGFSAEGWSKYMAVAKVAHGWH